MSTIKSSTEHLTLNADGASKDIKFQANGVEKASISSAGAFTSTSIDATKLSGALPAIDGSALSGVGKVLQVILGEDVTETVIATTSYTDVGLSATITPTSTTSKILVMWNMQGYMPTGDSGYGTQLLRDTTAVSTGGTTYDVYGGSDDNNLRMRGEWKYIDSPASTSAITYKIQCRTNGSTSVEFNDASNKTQILLMEIGA